MSITIILNPYANRWKGLEQKPKIQAAFEDAGVEVEMLTTESAGHGTELAFEVVEAGTDGVIAAGGDGTINEVMNGMMKSDKGPKTPLGVIPIGTANDLANNLSLPLDYEGAAAMVKAGKQMQVDLISVNGRYFSNNAGLGLEPYVSTVQNKMTNLCRVAMPQQTASPRLASPSQLFQKFQISAIVGPCWTTS